MTIEDIIQAEQQKMSWLDRLLMNYPTLKPTYIIAHSLRDPLPSQTTIKPSLWDKIVSIYILFFLVISWVGFLKAVLSYTFPYVIFLVGFFFIPFIIFLIVKHGFFNKKYIYYLTIDKEGISVDDRIIRWADIADTFIMNRQKGKATNYFLIILKKNETFEELDLFRMGVSHRKLASIVEYYKQHRKV